jgi:AcrR family transcriptional regulator
MSKVGRGPYAKSAEIKRGILDACITAFSTSGFHGVSMAEIARRAGISYTGMLHHFPNKEALLTSVLAMQDARAALFLEEHSGREGDDPVEIIRGMLETMVDRRGGVGLVELSAILGAEATVTTHPAHAHFRDRYAAVRSFLTKQYATLLNESRLSTTVAPYQLAIVTVAVMDGLQTQWLYDPVTIDVDTALLAALGAFIPELAEMTGPRRSEGNDEASR